MKIGDKVIWHGGHAVFLRGSLFPTWFPEDIKARVLRVDVNRDRALIEFYNGERRWVAWGELAGVVRTESEEG